MVSRHQGAVAGVVVAMSCAVVPASAAGQPAPFHMTVLIRDVAGLPREVIAEASGGLGLQTDRRRNDLADPASSPGPAQIRPIGWHTPSVLHITLIPAALEPVPLAPCALGSALLDSHSAWVFAQRVEDVVARRPRARPGASGRHDGLAGPRGRS
jgi:hypothetical protein